MMIFSRNLSHGRSLRRFNRNVPDDLIGQDAFGQHSMLCFGIISTACVVGFGGQVCPELKLSPIAPAFFRGINEP
ncbi:MAG: hypothetical protein GY904_29170 [Planctomycetaceae bacterium]|nr:hypothetical protein [Planctomycetaceae bacterium]